MKVKLGEICKIQYGFAFDSSLFSADTSQMPLVRIRDVQRGYTETFYSGEFAAQYIVRKGDLLIGMDGQFNIARWKSGNALLNQRVCKIIPNADCCGEFLRYTLIKELKRVEDRTSYVTVKHLSAKVLDSLELTWPPLDRQREIVRVLDKVEAVIDKHKRQLAKLDELAKARFVEMLNNNKPKNIPISSVGNVFTGSTPPTADPGNYEHRDIPFVKPSDLDMDYPVILDRIENYVAEKARGIVRMYPPNSVLVACIASVGKMGIATKPGTCNQQINVVVPDEGFHPVYIAHAIFSRQRYIIEAANKAVVPILNKRNFSQLTIPIIPLPLQRQFAEFVTHIERMKGKVRASLEATQKLLGSLMQEYFS